ncbi:MAG: cysteine synthase A [Clostridia bacterium]|nr:cysteine synthase A [Clostridia bacterium]
MTYSSLESLVGNTPLFKLEKLCRALGIKNEIFAKLEFYNPAGSVKDRVALEMIRDAEERGLLKPGGTIIEPTSGNTGIGLASIAVARGYKVILTMPDTMSVERRKLLSAFGAKLVLTDGKMGMNGAISKAEELAESIPGSLIAGQFTNPANPDAHYKTTGPEIWRDLDGKVDFFVSGAGTGGTFTGTARYLKEQDKNVKTYVAEPYDSAVLSGESASPHGLQGMGAGFIPEILDVSLIDGIVKVKTEDAYHMARLVARHEGILVGISSGAALYAAVKVAEKVENCRIATLFPDGGDRYLSTQLFEKN